MTTPSKNGAKNGKPKAGTPKFRFINYELTMPDKEWLADADVETEFPADLVDDLVMEGYKFSLSVDQRNSCFVASLTDREAGSPFENCCLTGRGASPAAARISLLYRHVHLAAGDWQYFNQGSTGSDEIYG